MKPKRTNYFIPYVSALNSQNMWEMFGTAAARHVLNAFGKYMTYI